MSTDATAAGSAASAATESNGATSPVPNKGKGKLVQKEVIDDEEDEEDEEEDEEEEEGDDDDDMEEDNLDEIDPSVIITSNRRTRGVRVDYTSAEALQKAGLKPEHVNEDEAEDSYVAHDQDMKDD